MNNELSDEEQVRLGIRALLRILGEDPDRAGLVRTPDRALAAFRDIAGRPGDPADILSTVFDDVAYPTDEMVSVGPIPFVSLCEHHLLPFTGYAWIAYFPSEFGVIGLSKLPRLLDHFAARPQVQERLTTQIADAMMDHGQAQGAAVTVRANHSCLSLRGAKKSGVFMVTSVLRGTFKKDDALRAEFLALTRMPG